MLNRYKTIKQERMAEILNLILGSGKITRGMIGKQLRLSPSSVAKYIKTLHELGLVREKGLDTSTGGRRSAYLEFDPEVGVNIALVFNMSSLQGALVNPAGELLEEQRISVFPGIPAADLLNKMRELITSLQIKANKNGKRIFGIGLGIGDHLNMESGISYYYHLAEGWHEVPLKDLVEKEFNLPFFLINDIDAGALGEKYHGSGVGLENFVCVWVDETVGMGLVLNGQIYLGKNGFVGEIGHTRALENGPLCLCGNKGCLETVTAESYILEQCRQGLREGVHSEATRLCGGDLEQLTIRHIIEASNRGDRFCRNIFKETAGYLGRSLVDVANILNPELISLRGSVVDGNQFLFEEVSRLIAGQAVSPICDTVRVSFSSVPREIRLPGVSSYILSRYFSE
jgi:predicted NBD/HSP70 family sugar kinase